MLAQGRLPRQALADVQCAASDGKCP